MPITIEARIGQRYYVAQISCEWGNRAPVEPPPPAPTGPPEFTIQQSVVRPNPPLRQDVLHFLFEAILKPESAPVQLTTRYISNVEGGQGRAARLEILTLDQTLLQAHEFQFVYTARQQLNRSHNQEIGGVKVPGREGNKYPELAWLTLNPDAESQTIPIQKFQVVEYLPDTKWDISAAQVQFTDAFGDAAGEHIDRVRVYVPLVDDPSTTAAAGPSGTN